MVIFNKGCHVFPESLWRYPGASVLDRHASGGSTPQLGSASTYHLSHSGTAHWLDGASAEMEGSRCRAWLCSICNASFSAASALWRHRQSVHFKRTPHECRLCGKAFTRSESLKDHMNGHRNVKPHKCPKCCLQFSHRTNFRKHVRDGVCDISRKPPS